jgi:hypothetical protein
MRDRENCPSNKAISAIRARERTIPLHVGAQEMSKISETGLQRATPMAMAVIEAITW